MCAPPPRALCYTPQTTQGHHIGRGTGHLTNAANAIEPRVYTASFHINIFFSIVIENNNIPTHIRGCCNRFQLILCRAATTPVPQRAVFKVLHFFSFFLSLDYMLTDLHAHSCVHPTRFCGCQGGRFRMAARSDAQTSKESTWLGEQFLCGAKPHT